MGIATANLAAGFPGYQAKSHKMSTSAIAWIDASHLNKPIVPSTRAETQAFGMARWNPPAFDASPDVFSDRSHDLAPASAGTELCLRSYRAKDHQEVLHLYRHGLLTGVPDPLDPATDLDAIEDVYLKQPQNHFWVGEAQDHVIASVAITEDDRQVAHVRRLRVDPDWKRSHDTEVSSVLIEKAAHHARQHDCLKLVLHTPVNDEWAIASLHQLGFEFARARELGGRHLLEFYLNIYFQPGRSVAGDKALV
jgi:N-acetylglutamate synthase-like GNAT family acetyltransferase